MNVLTAPARSIGVGARLTREVPDGTGGFLPAEPATVTAVDLLDGRLVFTLDAGMRMPFDPCTPVTVVDDEPFAPVVHPAWCCNPAACEADRDSDGTTYHQSSYSTVTMSDRDTGRQRTLQVQLTRLDDPDGEQGPATLDLTADPSNVDSIVGLTPDVARELARLFVDYAALADGDEVTVAAHDVRLGDLVDTVDGWQRVTSVLLDEVGPKVEIFTAERWSADVGWRFEPTSQVKVRREWSR